MDYHGTSFFVRENQTLRAFAESGTGSDIVLSISSNANSYDYPKITIFLDNVDQLWAFKASLDAAIKRHLGVEFKDPNIKEPNKDQ